MVRSAYGISGAAAPFAGRKRRAPRYVATGKPVCYVCIHRFRDGGPEEGIPSALRAFLRKSGAVFVDTEETQPFRDERGRLRRPDWKWSDWYAIAIPPQGIDCITAFCREKGIFDGPYWGAGRANVIGVGAGETRPGAKGSAIQRALVREVTARGNPQLLCLTLFGDRFPPLHLAPIPQAENAVDLMPDEWQWGAINWRKLVKDWPQFPQAYYVANLMHQCGALDTSAAVRLETWIRARIDKPKMREYSLPLSEACKRYYLACAIVRTGDTSAQAIGHKSALRDKLRIAALEGKRTGRKGDAITVPFREREVFNIPRATLALSSVCAYYRMALAVMRDKERPEAHQSASATASRLKGILRDAYASWKRRGLHRETLPDTQCWL